MFFLLKMVFVVSGRFDCVVNLDKFVGVLVEDILIYCKLRGRTGRVFENWITSVEREGIFMLSYQRVIFGW